MAGHTTPYPPDWKQQRRVLREQARVQRQAMRAQHRLYRERIRAFRTGSILAPLVLIAIGIVFLLVETGRLPALTFWNWYGRWWPVLLIGAGVLVLGEWALDRALTSDDRPVIRRGLGFGLWFIFFLVIITGTAASHGNFVPAGLHEWAFNFHDSGLAEFMGNLHEMDEPFTYSLPAGSALSIDNPRGGVNISGTSTDGQVHIQLHRQIYTNSDSDAQQKARQLTPQFRPDGPHRISVSLPSVQGTETAMTITVPANTPLSINSSHGSIDVDQINAAVSLTSSHGDINISSVTGTVDARLPNNDSNFNAHNVIGNIRLDSQCHDITVTDITGSVTIAGGGTGSAHLERISNAASYHSQRTQFDAARLDGQFDTNGRYLTIDQALGPVTLDTSSYDITLNRIAGNTTVENSNGTIDLVSAPPLGNLNISSRNGGVTVTLPQRSSFTVEANSTNGQIFSDFAELQPRQEPNHHASLAGAVGSGGPILRITTNSHGDISLRKTDVQPLPANPPAPQPAAAFPPPQHTSTMDARQQLRETAAEARQNIAEARREAQQARREAQREAEQARREARQASR